MQQRVMFWALVISTLLVLGSGLILVAQLIRWYLSSL